MLNKKFMIAAATLVATGMAATSQAATLLKTGDVVDGWHVTFPTGITLFNDGGSTLTFEKNAAFDSLEGLDITFTQVSANASPTLTIADESITNVSGTNFGGFQFLLGTTMPGNTPDASFTSSFNLNNPKDNIWTKTSFSPSSILLSGGNLGNLNTAKLGFGKDGGALVIKANPSATGFHKVIDFKEIPAVIPVPAAAWTGLSGLLGLGAIGNAKRLRKLLA